MSSLLDSYYAKQNLQKLRNLIKQNNTLKKILIFLWSKVFLNYSLTKISLVLSTIHNTKSCRSRYVLSQESEPDKSNIIFLSLFLIRIMSTSTRIRNSGKLVIILYRIPRKWQLRLHSAYSKSIQFDEFFYI